jgi:3-hydroxyisobutyrate dehydrogenase-like beta-hydroxyacid dehydrogenase
MSDSNIGILHPGNMGISIAASAQNSGYPVYWASQGRSQQTHDRANQYNLLDAHTLWQLCEICPTLISVCPPHAAEELAHQVLAHSFKGLYIDANAISPGRAKRIDQTMREAGADFVDGAIFGGPAWKPGKTWLHLSGKRAPEAASFFSEGPLETSIIGESPGKASALKMCYAPIARAQPRC